MKRVDLHKLGLKKELVNKIMDLHQIDAEKNKKTLAITKQNIKQIHRQLEDANSYINHLSMLIKKYEHIGIHKYTCMKAELVKKEKLEAKRLLFITLHKASKKALQQAMEEFNIDDYAFDEVSKNFTELDAFINYVSKLHINWISLLLQKQ